MSSVATTPPAAATPSVPAPPPAPSGPRAEGVDATTEAHQVGSSTSDPAETVKSGPERRPEDERLAGGAAAKADGPGATKDGGDAGPGPGERPASGEGGAAPEGGGAVASADELTGIWNESVLPSLSGLAKAMYAVGRFTEVGPSSATLAFPNNVHRQKCEQKRSEVEAALSARLGAPISLELVVDGEGGGGPAAVRHDGAPASADGGAEPDEDFDLGGHDVHDLDDAPDGRVGGLDALTEAFPGSELIEGQ